MKSLLVLVLLVTTSLSCFSQQSAKPTKVSKPPLDTSVFGKWPRVFPPSISNDGRYGFYSIDNQPLGDRTFIVREVAGDWKMQWVGVSTASFTSNSKKLIFLKPGDTLCTLALNTFFLECIPRIKTFKLFDQGDQELLAYLSLDKVLTIEKVSDGQKRTYTGVGSFFLSIDGSRLVLQTQEASLQSVDWINLIDGSITRIWQDSLKASNFTIDERGTQLAFVVEGKPKQRTIWYYRDGSTKAEQLASNQSSNVDSNLYIESIAQEGFSGDDQGLFITLKEQDFPKPPADAVMVDVWNYKDPTLQSEQLYELDPKSYGGGPQNYLAIVHLLDKRLVRLQRENDVDIMISKKRNDFAVANYINGSKGGSENSWNSNGRMYFFLISLQTGARTELKMPEIYRSLEGFSPDGKYIVGKSSKDILIYDFDAKQVRNVTKSLHMEYWSGLYDKPDETKQNRRFKIEGWVEHDEALLISCYKEYDIWQLDPNQIKSPVNVTRGYGKRNKIVFHLNRDYNKRVISKIEYILLNAFNESNKQNGYCTLSLNNLSSFRILTIGPYLYSDQYRGNVPIKSKDKTVYLVQRQTASECTNWFSTTDFKTFVPFTSLYPERNWNWITTELHSWKSLDGNILHGILYKPENFDSSKKYPVIFHYYEKMSQKLNEYEPAGPCEGWINIPWFVSNGYLVFTPDIYYTKGTPGQNVYNAVVSAAKYLAKFSFVNPKKMGITGHSWGGWETNYLVTHTNMFAAANSASGKSDLVSGYNIVSPSTGISLQFFCEVDQFRLGSTLWQDKSLFLKNSPVIYADKITTPLLLMNNIADGGVPFSQGVEMFTACRRLKKKAWMLQYDGEGHALGDEKAALDYTLRITQFFGHYLKESPVPYWMSDGIKAMKKGFSVGLDLDLKGSCGSNCEVCKKYSCKKSK